MFARSKGGFYHDGRYPTLMSVVEHYDSCNLSAGEKPDLVQYQRSRSNVIRLRPSPRRRQREILARPAGV